MTNISKKQVSLALVAVVFATALIIGMSAGNSAIASKHIHQHIGQHVHQDQSSSVVTSGTTSPVDTSGNNIAVGFNNNTGGNAAAN
jgi:hypothetical protein